MPQDLNKIKKHFNKGCSAMAGQPFFVSGTPIKFVPLPSEN